MFDSTSAELLWFLLGLAFILLELALPGFIVLFFGIGAWLTALGVWIGILDSFNAQLLVFIFGSLLSLILFRKKGKRYFEGKVTGKLPEGMSIDDIAGARAIVTAAIAPNSLGGKVEFHGTIWEAESDVPVDKGATVEIVERSNLRLRVRPLK
jgi:membrane protein implicated in regulation of membrane protease activity